MAYAQKVIQSAQRRVPQAQIWRLCVLYKILLSLVFWFSRPPKIKKQQITRAWGSTTRSILNIMKNESWLPIFRERDRKTMKLSYQFSKQTNKQIKNPPKRYAYSTFEHFNVPACIRFICIYKHSVCFWYDSEYYIDGIILHEVFQDWLFSIQNYF